MKLIQTECTRCWVRWSEVAASHNNFTPSATATLTIEPGNTDEVHVTPHRPGCRELVRAAEAMEFVPGHAGHECSFGTDGTCYLLVRDERGQLVKG